jgi:hypothetical protein
MPLMQSASSQLRRRAVYDGFDAEDADTSGTSHHRYRPCLNIRSRFTPGELTIAQWRNAVSIAFNS